MEAARRLESGLERDFAESLPGIPAGKAMLACLFGASPFLGSCAVRDPAYLRALWERGPDRCVDDALTGLRALPLDSDGDAAARALRVARRQVAFAVGLADIAQIWNLKAVTDALTHFAEAACSVALRHLLNRLSNRGGLSLPHSEDPERDSGLLALGLGKLGGRELNYSSDIDLILLYDPAVVPAAKRYEIPSHLMKLARSFVALLAEPTVDGRVFPVDLRLRPDPVSMPLVLSTEAALRYYGKRGQTWERAALIKARPVAGDSKAAESFLARLEPFVWQTELNFATVQDLHDIKKRIDSQHRGGQIGALGQNIKLGRGGIREIEFFAQAHQLVWGGADRTLRTRPTRDALRALADSGRIPAEVSETLAAAYGYLRGVEHRIQMVTDKQTHSLPKDPADFETLALFLGYPDAEAFRAGLEFHLRQVERQYESFFELPRELTEASASSALARGNPRKIVERLGRMGFRDPEAAFGIIEKWRTGRYRAASDAGALELLQSLTPALVIAMCGTHDPDLAIRRFDGMIHRLSDGLQVFSLFQANLHVMESVAEILVAAPTIGAILTVRPSLLEALLDPWTDSSPPTHAALEASLASHLRAAEAFGDVVDRLREWVEAARFRVGVQVLFHSLDPLDAPPLLSDIADCAVSVLLQRAEATVATKHGRIEGAGAAVVATGKFGSRELTFDSGLNFALHYTAPESARADGPDKIPPFEYFCGVGALMRSGLRGRPGQRQIYPCTADGRAIELDSLKRKLAVEEWDPARLGQVRMVACTGGIGERVDGVIRTALSSPRNPQALRARVAAMRGRIEPDCPSAGPWSVEHRPGGAVDIELVAQYLRLREATGDPVIPAGTTGEALQALERSGVLSLEDTARLLEGWRLWTGILTLQHLSDGNLHRGCIPERLRPLFQAVAGAALFEDVEPRMDAVASGVRAVCDRILGLPEREPSTLNPEAGSQS